MIGTHPDHRPALRKLLRTTLVTFNELLGALLVPPSHDPGAQQPPEFVEHIEWLRLNATNMIAAVNELRPVQVMMPFPLFSYYLQS